MGGPWRGGAGSQNVGELGIERLDDTCIGGRGGLGYLLRSETALRGQNTLEVGIDGVGDVDKNVAFQCFAVLLHYVEDGGIGDCEDDNVPGRGGAERSCRGTGSDLPGQRSRLPAVATHHFDGVSGLAGRPPIAAAMQSAPMMLIVLMSLQELGGVVFPKGSC